MIDKYRGKYYIRCDTCNTTAGEFDSFNNAVTYAKTNGWRLAKSKGNKPMRNYCPECIKRHKTTARDGNHKAANQ